MFEGIDKYKAGIYQYPDAYVGSSQKNTENYMLQYAEAMLAEYTQNRCDIPFDFGEERSFVELRQYATGKQSINKIKKLLCGNPVNGKYPTQMNISWQNVDIMSQIFDRLRSVNNGITFDAAITATDADSAIYKAQEIEFIKVLMNKNTKDFLQYMGVMAPQAKIDYEALGIQNEQDLDIYVQSGGLKLYEEIAAQACINESKRVSGYQLLQDKGFDDLITIAITGQKVFTNKVTGQVFVRYVDPAMGIIPYSQFNDFRDVNRAGEVRFMTIGDIRRESQNLSEADLQHIAKIYAKITPEYERWLRNNNMGFFGQTRNMYTSLGMSAYTAKPYDMCKVPVLDFEFQTLDFEKYLEDSRTGGNIFRKKMGEDYELTKKDVRDNSQLYMNQFLRKYSAKWIIGTKYFLEYGPAENHNYIRDEFGAHPPLSFKFVKTGNKSLVERCIEHIDKINLYDKKLMNAIALLPPAPRMAVQWQALTNVFLNGKKQTSEDLARTFAEKGLLAVNAVDDFGKPINQNGKLVDFMPSGITEDIVMFGNQIAGAVEMIQRITGVNDAMQGQIADRQAVGATKLALAEGNNSLKPTFNAMNYLFENTFNDVISKYQLIARYKPRELSVNNIGETNTSVLAISEDFAKAKLSITVQMTSNEDERMKLLSEIDGLRNLRTQTGGQGGITASTRLKLFKLIKQGQLDLAYLTLAQEERAQEVKDQQNKIANEQSTFQGQQESAKVAGEEARKTSAFTEAQVRKTELVKAIAKDKNTALDAFTKKEIDLNTFKILNQNYNNQLAAILGTDAMLEAELASKLQQEQMEEQAEQQQAAQTQ